MHIEHYSMILVMSVGLAAFLTFAGRLPRSIALPAWLATIAVLVAALFIPVHWPDAQPFGWQYQLAASLAMLPWFIVFLYIFARAGARDV